MGFKNMRIYFDVKEYSFSKVMKHWCFLLGFVFCSLTAGCADIQTVGRTTVLPPDRTWGGGKAVHLDAQQRLVVFDRDGIYCAEPSPDALAAYAASLGLGATVRTEVAASLANALAAPAGSIGLRTQSIQLMRDSLYRLCEAYSNGALEALGAARLLGRSQDLMAVVLAVEQLTGAVAASQIAINTSSLAGGSAHIVINQELVDKASEEEKGRKEDLNAATAKRDIQENKVTEQQRTVEGSLVNLGKATDENRSELEDTLVTDNRKLQDEKLALSIAQSEVNARQQLHEQSIRFRQLLEGTENAAATQADGSASSASSFARPTQSRILSDQATKEIAGTVERMVLAVLEKDYTIEACLNLLTSQRMDARFRSESDFIMGLSEQVVRGRISQEERLRLEKERERSSEAFLQTQKICNELISAAFKIQAETLRGTID